jgi:HEAT repeat protein
MSGSKPSKGPIAPINSPPTMLSPIATPIMSHALSHTQSLAAQADWVGVVAGLQQWLQARSGRDPEADRAAWLDLAIQALEAGDFQLRWDIGKLLPKFESAAMTAMLELLTDDDTRPEVRWFAVRVLAELPDPTIVPALLQTIDQTTSPELQQAAAQVLGQMGAGVIPPLAPLLASPQHQPTAAAILAQMRHPDAIAPLLTLAQTSDPTTRATAIEALSGFHTQPIAEVIWAALGDYQQPVRLMAVRTVGFCFADWPEADWLGAIQPLLHDLDLAVSRQAALTLGRLGTPGAIAALATLLESPLTPELLAIDAIRSLGWMEQPAAATVLGAAWATPTLTEPLRQILCEQLGRSADPQIQAIAVDYLINWFSHDPRVAQSETLAVAIAMALGRLGDPRAIAVLQAAWPHGPAPRLQLHRIAALKQLDSTCSNLSTDSPCV